MTHFALMYDVVDGFIDKRTPLRPAHLALVRDAHARGESPARLAIRPTAHCSCFAPRAPRSSSVSPARTRT